MEIAKYGNLESNRVIIQLVDHRDLQEMDDEVTEIRKLTEKDFCLIAVGVQDWNKDLSPWKSPAVFGKEDFGDGAEETLKRILQIVSDNTDASQQTAGTDQTYYLAGYSLAGLFTLWASYQTDLFKGVAAVSPSVWFPGFMDYAKAREMKAEGVYLSLGDKEERTKNPVMGQVGDNIRELQGMLDCTLEWNFGNHFQGVDLRMAKGIAWLLNR